MKKNLLIILHLSILIFSATAQQAPYLQWQKTYGGSGFDDASYIQQTTDSGYVIAGSTTSNSDNPTFGGRYDFGIVKTDATGNVQWEKYFGGSKNDYANCVQQTKDGGYILTGHSFSHLAQIIKLDANGNVQWQKNSQESGNETPNCIRQTTDGGYIVAGYGIPASSYYADYAIIKLDANGNIVWQKLYGGSKNDYANCIQQTTDGGYIIAGNSASSDGDVTGNHGGYYDCWIVKLDMDGNLQWQKSYGGDQEDDANNIKQTTDGGYIVAGKTYSKNGDVKYNRGSEDEWIIKLDASGNLTWQNTYGGPNIDYANDIVQTPDGGFVVAGTTASKTENVKFNRYDYYPSSDYWITKIDAGGNLKWQKSLGGTDNERASNIQITNDGGFVVAGASYSRNDNVSGAHGHSRSRHGGTLHRDDYWVAKLTPEIYSDVIRLNAYHTAINCSSTNSILCDLANDAEVYNIKLYRFGKICDSALNISGQVSFHSLMCGAYYATATAADGTISYSQEIGIVPPPLNLNTTNIDYHNAQLNWTGLDCTETYYIQYHLKGDTAWKDISIETNTNSFALRGLSPNKTYVWRILSEKRANGIKASGEFSDSVIFKTPRNASAFVAANNNLQIAPADNKSLIAVLPNPAKNYFIIQYKNNSQEKAAAVLYNVNGKAVWSSGLINASSVNNKTISTTSFTSGVYYLKLI